MSTGDRPNRENNAHGFDPDTALLAQSGHAALWQWNGETVIVITIGGLEGGKPVTRQIAYFPEQWENEVAMVVRMRARSNL